MSIATLLAALALFVALTGNLATATAARQNCERIESLNERVRDSARKSYDELDKNAALLGITVTPQLRRKALHDRNQTLARYAPKRCSLWFWK